ncbi:MAG: N-acetylmannosamine-6-phosphate 2-epimerase [Clostridium sp.]|nr:N-acetylmannosamine-6-phosphate 2-epimerase [Clostridium sp.]
MWKSMINFIDKVKGGLIVSCQALEDEPLFGDGIMAKMATAALLGGAVGIRANSVRDIAQIREVVDLPLIGLIKKKYGDCEVYITPTMKEISEVIEAGADVVAIDCTNRERPDGRMLRDLISEVKEKYPKVLIMADISSLEEGIYAEKLGVNIISTTLSGYTDYSPNLEGPDFKLISDLYQNVKLPIIAEGKISTPEEAKRCLDLGATSVVVGGAITRPRQITERFVAGIK